MRRLLALKVIQDFPTFLSHTPEFEEKEFPMKNELSANPLRPPPPLSSPSTSRIAFSTNNLPKCRKDRPDLYTARQCSSLDCFCVNVTTGDFLPGTRTNREELVDCSTGEISPLGLCDEHMVGGIRGTFKKFL